MYTVELYARVRRAVQVEGHEQTIGERFEKDRAALLELPATPYEACDKRTGRVSSLSLVRYRGNDYSVPVCWGHRASAGPEKPIRKLLQSVSLDTSPFPGDIEMGFLGLAAGDQ
jgi:hypothetical protein